MKKILLLSLSVLVLLGCSASRKMKAASILRQCKAEIVSVEIRSIDLDSTLFPKTSGGIFPNAGVLPLVQKLMKGELDKPLGTLNLALGLQVQNSSSDSLWLQELSGHLILGDSLLTSILSLDSSTLLIPGASSVKVRVALPVDTRLFSVTEAKKYRLQGTLWAMLEEKGRTVELEFDETKDVPQEEMKKMIQDATQTLVNQVLSQWTQSIK